MRTGQTSASSTSSRPPQVGFQRCPRIGFSAAPHLLKAANSHQLELLYFVVRHGGIMPAMRNFPCGIRDTAEGEKLDPFVKPCFRISNKWRRDTIDEPLICFPPGEPQRKNFQIQINKPGVDWFPNIETGPVDLIETYVASGLASACRRRFRKECFRRRCAFCPWTGSRQWSLVHDGACARRRCPRRFWKN